MHSRSPAGHRDEKDDTAAVRHSDYRREKKRKHRDADTSDEDEHLKGRPSRYDDVDSDKERSRPRLRTLEDGEIVKSGQDGAEEERHRSTLLDHDDHRGSRRHEKDVDRLSSPSPDRKHRSRDRRRSPSPGRKQRSRDRHRDSGSHRDGKGDRSEDRNRTSRGEKHNDSADERRGKHESRQDRNNGRYGKDNSGSSREASGENGFEEGRERHSKNRKDEKRKDQAEEKPRSRLDDGRSRKGELSSDRWGEREERSEIHYRSSKRGRKEHEEQHTGDFRHKEAPTRDNDADGTDRKATQNSSAARENNPSVVDDSNAGQGLGRSGGVYIPPFKLAQMMKNIQDKSSDEYQRMTWDALRKSINGLVNKVNASNIKNIIPELLSENLIRGRGLFARSCMKSQMASPSFTHVFAALVAVVNTKFPELGELLLKRVILQFRRALKRNDKPVLLAAAKFIAHLVNQQVAHEVVALEVLMVLLENPTDDSVEVAVGFVKESGAILQDLAPRGLHGIFERFRGILHEGEIDKRVQFMIEGLFAIRKAKFQGFEAIKPELDLVEQEDQFTHEMSLSDDLDAEMKLDVFKADLKFLDNEKEYETIKKDILGEDSSVEEEGERDSEASSEDEDDEEDEAEMLRMQIKDETETDLVNLRRTIYLTIMSSVDFEEAGHKLLKIKLQTGQEMELCIMLLECCSQERTYLRYYGLLGQRFCMINKVYQENFDECFVKQYSMIHRLETNKLRNVAKFFAHLLGTDALPWNVLAYIRLTEEDTTSSSRIFIKILFQELSEHLGLRKLNEKLNDPMMHDSFDGIFPKDNPKNTRFAINFFTSIGLVGITDNLLEYLKNMPKMIMQLQKPVESDPDSSECTGMSGSESSSDDDDSGSGSSSSSSTSDSSHSSSSTTSDSESESDSGYDSDVEKKKRRKKK